MMGGQTVTGLCRRNPPSVALAYSVNTLHISEQIKKYVWSNRVVIAQAVPFEGTLIFSLNCSQAHFMFRYKWLVEFDAGTRSAGLLLLQDLKKTSQGPKRGLSGKRCLLLSLWA